MRDTLSSFVEWTKYSSKIFPTLKLYTMQKTHKGNKIHYTKRAAYIQKRHKKTGKLRKIYITKKIRGGVAFGPEDFEDVKPGEEPRLRVADRLPTPEPPMDDWWDSKNQYLSNPVPMDDWWDSENQYLSNPVPMAKAEKLPRLPQWDKAAIDHRNSMKKYLEKKAAAAAAKKATAAAAKEGAAKKGYPKYRVVFN